MLQYPAYISTNDTNNTLVVNVSTIIKSENMPHTSDSIQ
jgi:hypothetical protein